MKEQTAARPEEGVGLEVPGSTIAALDARCVQLLVAVGLS
jgi:hypothetical protein